MNAYAPWKFCPWCGHSIDGGHGPSGCEVVETQLVDCTDPNCTPEDLLLAPGGTHAHRLPMGCTCKVARSQLTGEPVGNHR